MVCCNTPVLLKFDFEFLLIEPQRGFILIQCFIRNLNMKIPNLPIILHSVEASSQSNLCHRQIKGNNNAPFPSSTILVTKKCKLRLGQLWFRRKQFIDKITKLPFALFNYCRKTIWNNVRAYLNSMTRNHHYPYNYYHPCSVQSRVMSKSYHQPKVPETSMH